MKTKFVFQVCALSDTLIPQISRILEARTNRLSRLRFPKLWKITDRLNGKEKAPEKVVKARRTRMSVLGFISWFLGMFLLLPGLMEHNEMQTVLIAGACGVGAGVVTLWCYQRVLFLVLSLLAGSILTLGSVGNPEELGCFRVLGIVFLAVAVLALFRRRGRKSPFEKAAKKLLQKMENMPAGQIVFCQDGIEEAESTMIPYQDIEVVFETEDLIAPVYRQQIMILQKNDLLNGAENFQTFLMEHVELVYV